MDKTLDYYNKNAKEYVENTVNVDMKKIYKEFLKDIPKNSKILDIGCGSGRDSLYFKTLGYEVTAMDGSEELVKIASEILNQKVLLMDFEEIDEIGKFQGIWACASLLHVRREKLRTVLKKIVKKLECNGVCYMSFKYGDREFIDSKGRYFNCYDQDSFKALIDDIDGIQIKDLYITEDKLNREVKWINVFCIKLY